LPVDPARNRTDLAKSQRTPATVEVASNKTSTNQEGRGGGRRGIPSVPPEDQQGTAEGGDRRRKTESESGEKKGRTRAMEARMGGNPSAHLPHALLCLHRAISRTSPKSSRQAPSVPAGKGSSRAADGLVPDGGGEMHGAVQVNGASQGTKHGPPARPRPGWAFGRPHTDNQSLP
jgi:hypothetical protein